METPGEKMKKWITILLCLVVLNTTIGMLFIGRSNALTPEGTLDQYYDESHANTWVEIGDGGHAWRGQTFTVGINGQLKTVGLFVSYNRGAASDIIVEIRNVDTNGLPSGTGISHGTIASFSDTTYSWQYCIFSNPITVAKGTRLAMIFHTDSATYWWKIDGGNPSYPGGTYIASQDGDATWTKGDTNGDTIFRTYIVTSSTSGGGIDNVMLFIVILIVVIIALLIVVIIILKKKKQGPL